MTITPHSIRVWPAAARILLALSLALGVSYPLAGPLGASGLVALAWKGGPVAALALAALALAHTRDGRLFAIVFGLCALGDVLIERSLAAGALAFIAGHAVAIWLYRQNRRATLTFSQRLLTLLVVPLSVVIALLVLPAGRPELWAGAVVCTIVVATMAEAAWESRFPRYITGIGAMLFLASDLLIFARMGPLAGSPIAEHGVWPLYYFGQLLIFLGVTRTLHSPSGGPSAELSRVSAPSSGAISG